MFINPNATIETLPASVTNTEKGGKVTDKYAVVPTTKVINVLQDLGWGIAQAKAVKARKDAQHAKHIVELEHPTLSTLDDGDKVRVHVLNSHNGQSAFEIRLGIFRLVCSNGLVVSKGTVESYNIRHIGFAPEKVEAALNSLVKALPNVTETIKLFKTVTLDNDQLQDFALKSAQLRFRKEYSFPIMHTQLLSVRRFADKQNDLWSVYNRVQENLMRGGMTIIEPGKNGRSRTTRLISNINEQSRLNKGLWDLALNYTQSVPK